jgi:hypothetical protein
VPLISGLWKKWYINKHVVTLRKPNISQLALTCKLLFKDGNMPSYKDISIPNRSHKAIGNTLRELKKKYGDGAATAPASSAESEGETKSTKKSAPKKRAASATPGPATKKRATKKAKSEEEVKEDGSDEEEV